MSSPNQTFLEKMFPRNSKQKSLRHWATSLRHKLSRIPRRRSSSSRQRASRSVRDPGTVIVAILDCQGRLRYTQRMKGVEHHRHLPRLLLMQRFLRLTWMGPVREAVRMQRQRPVLDALAAHELAAGVINRFVGHHIGMVVRHGDRLRIEIEWPRAERADHEIVALEGLVHWRRQVKSAHTRLEVFDVDRPWIVV